MLFLLATIFFFFLSLSASPISQSRSLVFPLSFQKCSLKLFFTFSLFLQEIPLLNYYFFCLSLKLFYFIFTFLICSSCALFYLNFFFVFFFYFTASHCFSFLYLFLNSHFSRHPDFLYCCLCCRLKKIYSLIPTVYLSNFFYTFYVPGFPL